jgi:acetylornithine deacetylase
MPFSVAAVDSAVEQSRETLLRFLQSLVCTPSVTGGEQAAQRLVFDAYGALGLEPRFVVATREALASHPAFSDDGIPFTDRASVVGRWAGSGGGRSLILNGHVDVVPPGDLAAWHTGPWSGAIRDGRLYGRGACDMKAGLSAALIAVHALKAIGFQPAGDLLLESVVAEETGGIGTLSTIVAGYRADACIITEPTGLTIWTAQSGALTFRISIDGLAAHAAMKSNGVSAILEFMPILSMLERLDVERHQRFHHPLFADPMNVAPISIGVIHAGDWHSTVPRTLVAEGRFGIFPGESAEDARAELAHTLELEIAHHPWLAVNPPRLEWFEGQFDSSEIPADSDIVKVVASAHARVTSRDALLGAVSAGTDARLFTRYADIPTVLYGPGDVEQAHTVNESVDVEDVVRCAKTLAHAIVDWCGDATTSTNALERTTAIPTSA